MSAARIHRFSEVLPKGADDRILIGRSTECDLVLRDMAVSRRHAAVEHLKGEWRILDLKSRVGTFVNGKRITEEHGLRLGDEVSIGSHILVFDSPPGSWRGFERTTHASVLSSGASPILGSSAALRAVLDRVDRVAETSATVLITGESGTGKELISRRIHDLSSRRHRAYVILNCPALSGNLIESELFGIERRVATEVDPRPGLLEAADGGTVFLDEIGDLDPGVQAKLLRFLETKTIQRVGGRSETRLDVRILAATNQDLRMRIEDGTFRLDLFHRLNAVAIHVPPLRERCEDIAILASHFLDHSDRPSAKLTDAALTALREHEFPGNIRELQQRMRAAALFASGDLIDVTDLDLPYVASSVAAGSTATNAPVSSTPGSASSDTMDPQARELHRQLCSGASFWDTIREPFLDRRVSRDLVRRVLELGLEEASGSLRQLGRLYGIEEHRLYRRLVDFVRIHDLAPHSDRGRRNGVCAESARPKRPG